MRLSQSGGAPFDYYLPIYNWYYPLATKTPPPQLSTDPGRLFETYGSSQIKSRALYIHIPFCETICTFCPFERAMFQGTDIVDRYVDALLREIEIKAAYKAVADIPIRSIFVGGGTPSLLSDHHIRLLGQSLRSHFNLDSLEEFSYEMEVKSISAEKLAALRSIGVTHGRFGVQTFNTKYRRLFNLTASIEAIYEACELVAGAFPHISFDILYGINGQTVDEFFADVHTAFETGVPNIDFYPINNAVSQLALHRTFSKSGLTPLSGFAKHEMNVCLREIAASFGYLPHNGHGYVRVSADELRNNPVVTNRYSFVYHEHVYGYADSDIIGFGNNAISLLSGFTMQNTQYRNKYIKQLLATDRYECRIGLHDAKADASRGVVLRLPYHGTIEKRLVDWSSVDQQTVVALEEAVEAGLVDEFSDSFALTRLGWEWYVNLIFYLSPHAEKRAISSLIRRAMGDRGRDLGNYDVPGFLGNGDVREFPKAQM